MLMEIVRVKLMVKRMVKLKQKDFVMGMPKEKRKQMGIAMD